MTRGLVQLLEKIRKLISTKGYKITCIKDLSDSDMTKASVFSFIGRNIEFDPSSYFQFSVDLCSSLKISWDVVEHVSALNSHALATQSFFID